MAAKSNDHGQIDLAMAPPAVVATIGVHGSASTWIFNIVRELLIAAFGQETVLVGFAGGLGTLPAEHELVGRRFLLKSHNGSADLDTWLTDHQAHVFLSIRDPRDAALSMVRRFNRTLPDSIRMIERDNVRMIRLQAQGHRLFRYEDRFFERLDTINEIAAALALKPCREEVSRIFARYTRDAVLGLAASLAEGNVDDDRDIADPVTYIHKTHIGDGITGKWRALPVAEQADLNRLLGPIIAHFGYPPE